MQFGPIYCRDALYTGSCWVGLLHLLQWNRDGNGSVGHGSWVKWVTIFGWVTWVDGHSQWPIDPWWNNCAVACNFKYTTYSNTIQRTLFLVDIKKLLTHSIRPIIIAGGLILIYDFFALKTERVVQYHHATPLLVPCVGWNDVMAMGHGSRVMWVIGHLCDGSHGSRKMTHFHLCSEKETERIGVPPTSLFAVPKYNGHPSRTSCLQCIMPLGLRRTCARRLNNICLWTTVTYALLSLFIGWELQWVNMERIAISDG